MADLLRSYHHGRQRHNLEVRYYNAKGEPARAYELAKHDIFSISKNGIDGTVEVGKEVSVENYRLKAAD